MLDHVFADAIGALRTALEEAMLERKAIEERFTTDALMQFSCPRITAISTNRTQAYQIVPMPFTDQRRQRCIGEIWNNAENIYYLILDLIQNQS